MVLENKAIISLSIIFIAIVLQSIFAKVIIRGLLKLTSKTKTDLDTAIVKALEKPLKMLIILIGIYSAFITLEFSDQYNLMALLIFRSFMIIIITWAFVRFSDIISRLLLKTVNSRNIQVEGIFVPFISKGIKAVIMALALSIVAGEWGFDVNGFITGLGIGGLAFALAAQDTLSNIIAGLVLTMDKPFDIGDWICTPNLEGTVEEISFRSTKVRTFAHAIVHVPNSSLANQAITNWSRMGKRRIAFNLGLEYATSTSQIKKCVEDLKGMLKEHLDIHKETIFVSFDNFNESSLDIFVYCFTITTNWGKFLEVKQDVNFKILEILETNGVAVAFPSRAIYLKND